MNKTLHYKFLLGIIFLCFFSCEEILFEKDISKNEVILIAPTNSAQFFSTGITFTWETTEETIKYQLQIAKPNFTNPLQIITDTIIAKTTFTQQLPVGEYEWKVRALNGSYATNYTRRSFTVVSNTDFQSNIVILNTPSNNLITKIALQSLIWQPIIGATGYQIQIYNESNAIISDKTVTAANLSYTFLQGNYQWKVRATNGTQQTLYSSRSILVDTTAPNAPLLSSPTNASTTTNNDISFQWSRTPILGSVEKDSIYIYKNSALTILHQKKETNSPFSQKLDLGNYYWFVKSFDEAGNFSNRSSVFNFTIN
jgi:hypothetical protein